MREEATVRQINFSHRQFIHYVNVTMWKMKLNAQRALLCLHNSGRLVVVARLGSASALPTR